MTTLPFRLDRSIVIHARRDTVFRFFTDSKRWASWWGDGSTIDPRPGGHLLIRYPGGLEAVGEVVEVASPERIVFTYGYASGERIPPGGSRVTLRLDADGDRTRLHLLHEFADDSVRVEHEQGWRYQLSVFANIVAEEVHAGVAGAVDAWFRAWSIADERDRTETLSALAAPYVQVRDRYSAIDGLQDLMPHIAASQRFMPGIELRRKGGVRHCQGFVLADWIAVKSTGQEMASGTNLFAFEPGGRITAVTGFWN
jgi:uncharacterized protein YndB with AHSA1/START domain